MLKTLYAIIPLLICFNAQASDFISFDNPGLTRTERLIRLQVEKHNLRTPSLNGGNSTDGSLAPAGKKSRFFGATSRGRVQIAVSGVHQVSNNPAESIQSVRAIDGHEDAIEISQENTRLPPEYMALPTSKKDMRKYVGR